MNGLMKTLFFLCHSSFFMFTLKCMKILKHRNHNSTVFAKKQIIARNDLDDNLTMFARDDAFLAETYPADILIRSWTFHVVRWPFAQVGDLCLCYSWNIISNPIQKSRVDNNVNIQWLSALKWDYTCASSDDNFFRRSKWKPKKRRTMIWWCIHAWWQTLSSSTVGLMGLNKKKNELVNGIVWALFAAFAALVYISLLLSCAMIINFRKVSLDHWSLEVNVMDQ